MKIEIIFPYRNDAAKAGEWSQSENRKYRPTRVIAGKPGSNYPGVDTGGDHSGLAERRVVMAESTKMMLRPRRFWQAQYPQLTIKPE